MYVYICMYMFIYNIYNIYIYIYVCIYVYYVNNKYTERLTIINKENHHFL